MYAAQENSRADETVSTRLSSRLLMATPTESSRFKMMNRTRFRQMSHYLPCKRIATPASTHNPKAKVPETTGNTCASAIAVFRQELPVTTKSDRSDLITFAKRLVNMACSCSDLPHHFCNFSFVSRRRNSFGPMAEKRKWKVPSMTCF